MSGEQACLCVCTCVFARVCLCRIMSGFVSQIMSVCVGLCRDYVGLCESGCVELCVGLCQYVSEYSGMYVSDYVGLCVRLCRAV